MLGSTTADYLTQGCGSSFMYNVFHPTCWSLGGGSSTLPQIISTTAVSTPAAPQTQEAMTVYGVWTPDYAMQRTYADEQQSLNAAIAAGQSIQSGQASLPDVGCGSSTLYDMSHSSCWGNVLGLSIPDWIMPVVVGVGVVLLVRH